MARHVWLLMTLWIGVAFGALLPAQAATNTLSYSGVQSCYVTGSVIPPFTLTATVALTAEYRMTHRVDQNGAPGAPTTVYEGAISSNTPHSVAITGGNATVPGTYTLVGSLYLVSSGVLLAQTQETVLIADPCPTPTPVPPPPSGTPQPEAPADIRWSQSAMPSRGAATGTILKITVRAHNIGRGAGRSDAILTYDPQFLRLLDAQPQRDSDWIRARDDQRGMLTVAAGLLHPNDQGRLLVRFLVTGAAPTTVLRLVRDDGRDRGNPLFLTLGKHLDGPLVLEAQRVDSSLKIAGRGYKPDEPLSLWSNYADGSTAAIPGVFHAHDDQDGTLALNLPALPESVTSVVVYGRSSLVTGVLERSSTKATATSKGSARPRSKASTARPVR